METRYASAKRQPIEVLLKQSRLLDNYPFIREIFCSLSYIFCILNEDRQLVFANDVLMKALHINHIDQVLGKRFGEVFECVHARDERGGCGTSEHCRFCGAVNSMLESARSREKTMKECRIRRVVMGKEASIELEVTSTPFEFEGNIFTIFSVIDITDKKRKAMIERIFFHDILNTAGSLNNIFEMLSLVSPSEREELLTIAASLSGQVVDEITTQRLLIQAENASLVLDYQRINTLEFLDLVEKDLKYHDVATGKTIVTDKSSESLFFLSDAVVLRKIMINMIKNALEASGEGQIVTLKTASVGNHVRLSVHNSGFMPPEVEMQVFMRSFSTKGVQRGLGTYSMKILGEQYLGGEVNFETDPVHGTTFYIVLPQLELD